MPVKAEFRRTFAALSVPNFRRYMSGQAISLAGNMMQGTAQSWLVLTLTHSAALVGVTVAVQTLPVLLVGPYGGLVADRVNKRRLLFWLNCLMGVLALILALLAVTGVVRFWEVLVLSALFGMNSAFENPARQSMMLELSGAENVRNAVSLYATTLNLARTVGPAIAGVLIASFGVGICFLINAATFIPVVISLTRIDESDLRTEASSRPETRSGGLREGIAYVARSPDLAVPLSMMALVGCLAFEWPVTLPYMAEKGLHAGSEGFGFMTAALSIGSVVGGLVLAGRGKTGSRLLVLSAVGMGIALVFAAVAPDLPTELLALALVGSGSVVFMSGGNATLQIGASPGMRGRVMSLWTMCFMGSTPIGGPIVGVVMSVAGARAGLGLGAAACLAAAAGGALALRILSRRVSPAGPTIAQPEDRSSVPPA